MEQRIKSPFQLPRERDNRETAHSGDAPVFAVTHRTLKGTVAAPHPQTRQRGVSEHRDANCGSGVFNIQHTLHHSHRNQYSPLQLPSKALSPTSLQAADAHRAGDAASTRSLRCHQKGPQPGAPFASRKRATPSD